MSPSRVSSGTAPCRPIYAKCAAAWFLPFGLPVTLTMTSGARLTMRASRARVLPPWPARLELSERSNISAPRLFGSLVSFGLNSAASWPASKLLSKSLTGHLPIDKISFRSGADTFDGRADRRAHVVDLLQLAGHTPRTVPQRPP